MSIETVHSSSNTIAEAAPDEQPSDANVMALPAVIALERQPSDANPPDLPPVAVPEPPAPVSPAPPASRPPLLTLFEAVKKTTGKRGCKPWADLFQMATFQTPTEFPDKKTIGGWSPALFKDDKRLKTNVEQVTALVLDYDAKLTNTTVAEAVELWGDYSGAIHTTWSSTPERQCFRVILPFSRPVTPDEYPLIWTWARNEAAFMGQQLDEQTKDASRLWYLPGVRPGARPDYQLVLLPGQTLDPDRVLAAVAASGGEAGPAQPEPVCGEDEDASSVPTDVVLARARTYLAKIPPRCRDSSARGRRSRRRWPWCGASHSPNKTPSTCSSPSTTRGASRRGILRTSTVRFTMPH